MKDISGKDIKEGAKLGFQRALLTQGPKDPGFKLSELQLP